MRNQGPDSGAKKFGLENGFRNGFNLSRNLKPFSKPFSKPKLFAPESGPCCYANPFKKKEG